MLLARILVYQIIDKTYTQKQYLPASFSGLDFQTGFPQENGMRFETGQRMQKPTLAEQIASRLRRDILLGKLEPGESVKERDNALELGVSRTPMREAIRLLANEGMVVLRPSRSPIVANPSYKEVSDNLHVIRALEVLSGELACASAKRSEIRTLRNLHERMIRISTSADSLDFFETDMKFHRAIVQASRNPALMETHQTYMSRLWRVRYLSARLRSDRARVLEQHGLIVQGLEERDIALVTREIASHIRHIDVNISGFFANERTGKPGGK